MATITNSQQIRISVCIAVYNVGAYLRKCLNSLYEQTLLDAEFIIVDDCSNDDCPIICQEFVNKDNRFKLIRHKVNKGTLATRKTGIKHINGRYAMFLDGDDFLPSNVALLKAVNLIENSDYDIIRFTSKIFCPIDQNLSITDLWINGGTKNIPHSAIEYLNLIFKKGDHGWVVWNKIYTTSILKTSLKYIPDEYFICAEDVFLTFLFTILSKRIISIDTTDLYVYRLGSGISTSSIKLDKFINHYAKEVRCTQCMEGFSRQYIPTDLTDIVNETRKRLILVNVVRLNALPFHERAQGFDALVQTGFNSLLISALAKINRSAESMSVFSKAIFHARSLVAPTKHIKTVAFLYSNKTGSPAYFLTNSQISIFLDLGYRVILLKDDISDKKTFSELGIETLTIPSKYSDGRAKTLEKTIATFAIDLIILQENSKTILWDLLLIRLNKVHSVISLHEANYHATLINPSSENFIFDSSRPYFYKFASYIVSCNKSQIAFFSAFGNNTAHIPYLPSLHIDKKRSILKFKDRNGVFWIGDCYGHHKNYIDIIDIYKTLIGIDPVCQCFISVTKKDDNLLQLINHNSFANRIHFVVVESDAFRSWIKKARVLCITNYFEGLPILLNEAQTSGTPVVMYKLRGKELYQNHKGIITVAPGDINSAASAIKQILNDENICNSLIGEQVYTSDRFHQLYINNKILWEQVLEHLATSASIPKNTSLISEEIDSQNEFIKESFMRIEKDTLFLKRIYKSKAMKFFLLGLLHQSKKKRIHYQHKLKFYLTELEK